MNTLGSSYKSSAHNPPPRSKKNSILASLKTYPTSNPDNLIPILQKIQYTQGYISPEAIKKISSHLKISRSRVFGVASFYSQFRFNPPGRHSIKICLGSACHVQGGEFLLYALQREIGIEPGQTTADGSFDLERLACLGCCALAPVMMVDDDIHSRITIIKLPQILAEYE